MAKHDEHVNDLSGLKSNRSTGTKGESAGARNKSGNHTGNRAPSIRSRGNKTTRYPKSY